MEGMDHSQHRWRCPDGEEVMIPAIICYLADKPALRSLHPMSKEPNHDPFHHSLVHRQPLSGAAVDPHAHRLGLWSVKQTPVDALPDLSDVQVIIKTAYPGPGAAGGGGSGDLPAHHRHAGGAGATTVRGYSFFGDSFVYVLFDDNTDLYWARARVLEYLSQVAPNLPASARPQLGPDATGVGWVYQYALVDKTGKHDLSELTSCRTGSSSTSCRRWTGSPKSPPWAAWCASIRCGSTRTSCAPTASRSPLSRPPSSRAIRRQAPPSSRWRKRSTWCAPTAI